MSEAEHLADEDVGERVVVADAGERRVSVVSAIAASGRRSWMNRPVSSAAMCWLSAAEPPLPHNISLPPLDIDCTMRDAAADTVASSSPRRANSAMCCSRFSW
jgi:hypothetical protein